MSKKTINIKQIEDKLRLYNVLIIEIDNLEIDLEDYRERLGTGEISLGSKSNNPLPGRVSARPASSQVENILIGTVTDADIKYYKLQEYKRLIKKIDNILSKIPRRDRVLVEGFYLKNKSLLELAEELNLSENYLTELKRNVLQRYFQGLI